jgi:hypothetical protein
MRRSVVATLIVAGLAALIALCAVPQAVETVQRSREKRTMHKMLHWSTRIERALAETPARSDVAERWRRLRTVLNSSVALERVDGWGTPLAIHVTMRGYEIRSAAADRRFEEVVHQGEKTSFAQDLVFVDGTFVQFPAGVITVPEEYDRNAPAAELLSNCRQCHGRTGPAQQ